MMCRLHASNPGADEPYRKLLDGLGYGIVETIDQFSDNSAASYMLSTR